MKAFEFETSLTSPNTLSIPPEIGAQLSSDQRVRVLLLVSDADEDEDEDWARLTTEQFLKGYDDSDAIYDNLPGG